MTKPVLYAIFISYMEKIIINKILIPNKPHLDPLAAIYVLMKYGEDKFAGIKEAEIIYWDQSRDPSNEEINQFKADRVLLIDVTGGIFDHHDLEDNIEETSTSLVAKFLGVENNPELNALLSYVREDDLEGLHNRFGDMAYVVKCLHKQNVPNKEVVDYALRMIDILQESQYQWHHEVRKEYEAKVNIVRVRRQKKRLKIGVMESDNIQIGNYGITADNLSVVVQKRSSGHVVILTNKHHRVNLREIVAAIRMKELEYRGVENLPDPRRLQYEGKSMQIPQWFYHRSLNSFLNGSDALSQTDATRVPFTEIVELVKYGISTDDSELCDCDRGGKHCPFACYGFNKCLDKKRRSILSYR